MRKIYQSVPDVPQVVANKAVEIIERHLTAVGVRRAEELPEENKVRLMRELQAFFMAEFPHTRGEDGELIYDWSSHRGGGMWRSIGRWFRRVFHTGNMDPEF